MATKDWKIRYEDPTIMTWESKGDESHIVGIYYNLMDGKWNSVKASLLTGNLIKMRKHAFKNKTKALEWIKAYMRTN